ncbi:helix-turn-helix domain-containing protein [Ferrimonas aestuarii]|nr:helix-turn-helix domain-containing protein [Ferrimonas aestuarii]
MEKVALKISQGAFGRLLRFWRKTRGLSQEALAYKIDTSLRHFSFLETGKSLPSADLIERVAQELSLNIRETNNLLAAAGYAARSFELRPNSPEHQWLTQSLIATLKGLDPYPTMIIDQCGNAKMINRAFVAMVHHYAPLVADAESFNMIDLIFTDRGFKPFLIGWEDTICALVLTLQQDVLMYQDPCSIKLLQRILKEPSLPKDWRKRGSKQMNVTGFVTTTQFPGKEIEQQMHVVHTVGATSFVSEPKLMIYTIYPKDFSAGRRWQAYLDQFDGNHHLLPY